VRVPVPAIPYVRAVRGHVGVVLLVIVLAGCGSSASSPPSSTGRAESPSAASLTPSPTARPDFPVTITDDDGTTVTIETKPERIVSLTPAETEILFALGAGDRVVGKVEDSANYPPEAASVPVVGSFDSVDVEAVVGPDPDLVLAGGSGGTPPDAIDRMRALGLAVVVVYAADVEAVFEDIELTGTVVGEAEAAADLVEAMRAGFEEIANITAGADRPRVFYETGDQPAIYGIADDSVYAEMIELAGGDPITTGSASNWEMPLEMLVEADPELIILGDAAYGVTAEAVAARPGWSGMTAVRNAAITPIDDIVVTRPGPRLVEGLRLLAGAIHPEVELSSPVPSPSGG
jgi:iron complex transport system substrate-binding protein